MRRQRRARGFTVHETWIEDFAPAAPFDVAVLSNVLEHASDPRVMLRHVKRILKQGGEVRISLPNAESALADLAGPDWINWHVPFHIVHFTRLRLARLLEEEGFAVTGSTTSRRPSGWRRRRSRGCGGTIPPP